MGVLDPATMVLPDITGAVMLKLRSDSRIAALCHPSATVWTVAPQISPDWAMPTWAIILRRAGGGMGGYNGVPVHSQRFDLWFYGPGDTLPTRARNADLLWRTAHPVICPPRHSGVSRAFMLGKTRVMDIEQESEPISMLEPDTNWSRVNVSYLVTYNELVAP